MPSASDRSSVSLLVMPSDLASSCRRMFFGTLRSAFPRHGERARELPGDSQLSHVPLKGFECVSQRDVVVGAHRGPPCPLERSPANCRLEAFRRVTAQPGPPPRCGCAPHGSAADAQRSASELRRRRCPAAADAGAVRGGGGLRRRLAPRVRRPHDRQRRRRSPMRRRRSLVRPRRRWPLSPRGVQPSPTARSGARLRTIAEH
jgi:hypothetical protein